MTPRYVRINSSLQINSSNLAHTTGRDTVSGNCLYLTASLYLVAKLHPQQKQKQMWAVGESVSHYTTSYYNDTSEIKVTLIGFVNVTNQIPLPPAFLLMRGLRDRLR